MCLAFDPSSLVAAFESRSCVLASCQHVTPSLAPPRDVRSTVSPLHPLADNRRIPYNHRQRSFPNGSLLIDVLDKRTDSGEYKCSARSGHKVAFKLVKVMIDSKCHPSLSCCKPLRCCCRWSLTT